MNIFLACFLACLFSTVVYGLGLRAVMGWRFKRMMMMSRNKDMVGGLSPFPLPEMTTHTGQELLVLSPGKPVDLLATNSGCEIRLHFDNDDKWTGRIEAVQVSDPPLVVSDLPLTKT